MSPTSRRLAVGKRSRAGEPVAVVEHPDVEADLRREPRHRLPDVPAADQEERDPRLRRQVGDAVPRRRLAGASRAARGCAATASHGGLLGEVGHAAARRRRRDSGRRWAGRARRRSRRPRCSRRRGPRGRAVDGSSRAARSRTGPSASERLGEDGHPPAADQAVVPAVIVVQAEGEDFGPAGVVEPEQRPALHLGLDAPAAERAGLRAVGVDEHRRAGLLRRAAAGLDDRAVHARRGRAGSPESAAVSFRRATRAMAGYSAIVTGRPRPG